jgi:NAD(P)-dependent dehydrogenase (short-subunit alcohol dehydrogenase family)
LNAQPLRVLLVGASGVIGRHVHRALAKDCAVITAGLDDANHPVNLTDAASIHALLQAVHGEGGPLDAVISTAGRASFARLADIDAADGPQSVYGLGLQDKLMGQVNLALAARAVLKPGGVIVLTTGTTSREPIIGGSSLSMVNGAIECWVRAAATELGNGLRLNAVSPSLVEGTPAAACAAFPGFAPVSGAEVGLAYVRCVRSGLTGQVVAV